MSVLGNRVLLCVGLLAAGLVGQGIPNQTQTPGALLSGLNAPQQGRTAVIAYHNGSCSRSRRFPPARPAQTSRSGPGT